MSTEVGIIESANAFYRYGHEETKPLGEAEASVILN